MVLTRKRNTRFLIPNFGRTHYQDTKLNSAMKSLSCSRVFWCLAFLIYLRKYQLYVFSSSDVTVGFRYDWILSISFLMFSLPRIFHHPPNNQMRRQWQRQENKDKENHNGNVITTLLPHISLCKNNQKRDRVAFRSCFLVLGQKMWAVLDFTHFPSILKKFWPIC